MKTAMAGFGTFVLVIAGHLSALAQDASMASPPAEIAGDSTLVTPAVVVPATGDQPIYTSLNLKQKWLYSMEEIFGPARLAAYAVHAGIDQMNDTPKQWGTSGDSLAVRLTDTFGDSLLRHNVEFAIRALDHEDPRYFRSGQHGAWNRTKYAVVHTFAVRKDDGSLMPAYSLLLTDYGMPFVVREWRPQRFRTMDGMQAGTLGIGIAMGSNIFSEFWPDLKKKLPKLSFIQQR